MPNISNQLTQLRQMRGLSPNDVATRLRTDPALVVAWETGTVVPDLPAMIALADVYGASLDEVAGRRPVEPRYPGQEMAASTPRSLAEVPSPASGWKRLIRAIPLWAWWAGLPFLITFLYVTLGMIDDGFWEVGWIMYPLYPVLGIIATVVHTQRD